MRQHPALDNPAWHALGGPHRGFGIDGGSLRRYVPHFAPFNAAETPAAMAGLSAFLPPDAFAVFIVPGRIEVPEGLELITAGEGVQMVADAPRLLPVTAEHIPLGAADVPEIMALVELTQPGPFATRTIEIGRYIGVRDNGRLAAITGERMHLPGYTEVSAVCVHPDFRGRGLGKQLISAICEGILARDETPFLHVRAGNREAISLYESLGFAIRTTVYFSVLKHAGASEDAIPTYLRPHRD